MFSPENLVIILPVLVVAMSIHEAMHAFMAHWLGDPTARDLGRLSLNPFKHIDPFTTIVLPVLLVLIGAPPILAAKPVPFNPNLVKYEEFGAALVGISGPISNLLMAGLGAVVLRTIELSGLPLKITVAFVTLNVALFVFNMLPFPPLDGSRLLYAFAPEPVQRLMAQIEGLGIAGIVLLLVVLIPIIGPILTKANQAILLLLLS